jgi:ATP-dependent Lon protease
MVTTRSKANNNHLELNSDIIPINNNKKKKSIQIKIIPSNLLKKNIKTEDISSSSFPESKSDSEEDIEDDEESLTETYYDYIDDCILTNLKLKKKLDSTISYIQNHSPTLEDLLLSKMRKKHKAELLELFLIYENLSLLDEEKSKLRTKLIELKKMYETQYEGYLKNKKIICQLEKHKSVSDLYEIQLKIAELPTHFENKKVIYSKYAELMDKKQEMDEEYYKLKNWIQFALQLPHNKVKEMSVQTNIQKYLVQVKSILDSELYGMNLVKEQLLLFIHSKLINPNVRGCCLGLVGPPGVGKTSIARCLAKIMDIPFSQITFGGINSADYIRGYDYTYIGSKPGEIVRCLSRMKYKNGIIFFDEYEKISKNPDINACLLHITDFSQNSEFRDNYLSEITIDLSSIWFIYSMNELPEDEALRDRIFFINVDGYNIKDQIQILCNYLLPKHLQNLNLNPQSIHISESVADYMIQKYGNNEKGVRTIEKLLKDLIQKISFLVTNQDTISTSFTSLPRKYLPIQFPFHIDTFIIDLLLTSKYQNSKSYLNMYL